MFKAHFAPDEENLATQYFIDHGLREPESLRKLREATLSLGPKSRMICDAEQAQMFRLILKLMGAKKAIEVGVFTGYNSLSVAMALPPDGKVVACDVTDEYLNEVNSLQFMKEAGVENKIEVKIQPALKTMEELLVAEGAGSYDFVFIDADKQNYEAYYEKALELLRPGGLVAIDNVYWQGRILDLEKNNDKDTVAIHELNKKIHADDRVQMSMLPFADGVTLARKL